MKLTEFIEVEYTYQCPIDNYLDGELQDIITETYFGPDKLFLIVNEDGIFETVLLAEEVEDGRPIPKGHIQVELDCQNYPLVAEVLSDFHANNKDDDNFLETVGLKTIPTPDGYEEFTYEYPIHPDHLYDDLKSTYNFETGEVELYKNTNADILGEKTSWDDIRRRRNAFLVSSDSLAHSLSQIDQDKSQLLDTYRQNLRDLPELLNDIDPIFIDSSFPTTKLIEI